MQCVCMQWQALAVEDGEVHRSCVVLDAFSSSSARTAGQNHVRQFLTGLIAVSSRLNRWMSQ